MKDNRNPPGSASDVASQFAPPYEQGKADERARIIGLLQKFKTDSRAAGLMRSARISSDLITQIDCGND